MRIFPFKRITFQPLDEYIEAAQATPLSASKVLPEWYRNLPRYVNQSDKPIKALGRKDLKMCVPFRDAMISGYVICLPCDIEVQISADGDVDVFSNPQLVFRAVEKRGSLVEQNQGFGMPHPIGTTPIMFAWTPMYGVKTNKRNSILITHPLNRHDLPFVTTSGIIDSGFFSKAGNIPFFFKEGFTGVIPKGTPIAQVLPFRRDNWISKITKSNFKEYSLYMTLRDTYLDSFYGRFLRQPKRYK